jgi:hypothetical protein
MADSTEVAGGTHTTSERVAWVAGYAAALEDVSDTPIGIWRMWLGQPMQTARLAWRRRINGGAS